MGIIVLSYLQHLLIHNDFYSGRFALFTYPLFMLNLLFLMEYLYKSGLKVFPTLFVYGLATLLVLNFSLNMNLWFYQDWKSDAGTKTVVNIITQQHSEQPSGKKVSLGINWTFEPTVNFYRYTYDLDWLKEAHRKGASVSDDYFYLLRSDTNAYLAGDRPVLFSVSGVNSFLVKNQSE